MPDRSNSQIGRPPGVNESSLSSLDWAMAVCCRDFCPMRRATMGAARNIQFSDPQLEQIRCAEEETTKARFVSQSTHKTIRFSSSLARLMSLRLILEPLSNPSHVVRLIVFLHSARRLPRCLLSKASPRRVALITHLPYAGPPSSDPLASNFAIISRDRSYLWKVQGRSRLNLVGDGKRRPIASVSIV